MQGLGPCSERLSFYVPPSWVFSVSRAEQSSYMLTPTQFEYHAEQRVLNIDTFVNMNIHSSYSLLQRERLEIYIPMNAQLESNHMTQQ